MYNQLDNEVEQVLVVDNGRVEKYEGAVCSKWSYETFPDNYPSDYPDDMDNYVARDIDGCPYQGFMKYIPVPHPEEKEPYIEMRQIFVRTQDRGKGVATKLFKQFPKICKENGIYRVVVAAYFSPEQENDFCHFLRAMKFKQFPFRPNEFDWEKKYKK